MQKFTTILLSACTTLIMAQSNQVLNSINYVKSKELDKAKIATDLAVEHETTKGSAKTWLWYGKVYLNIFTDTSAKVRAIDKEAEEKSLQGFITALKIDAKDNIYKDELKGLVVQAAAGCNNKAHWYERNKEYEKALKCYDLVEAALPYDFDQSMKRNNMTKEKIMFNKFDMYRYAGDKAKTIEYGDKLIGIGYKDPGIYLGLAKICMGDRDTAKALTYIEKGKAMFEDNMALIGQELDIYIARKKTDVLKDKIKAAIELAPDNEVLHMILGTLYKETKDPVNAEKEFLKSIELKPDFEPANYNLGVFYYSLGKDWNDKLGNLPPKDPKTKEYEKNKDDNFKKAVEYLEKSYTVTKDKQTKQVLRQLYLRLGDTAKADQYK